MIPREVLKKVKRIEIQTRGLVNNFFGGEYHSVFKGRGMTFSEVRQYQQGDDIRLIDWNGFVLLPCSATNSVVEPILIHVIKEVVSGVVF